jgi:hypothetical protein
MTKHRPAVPADSGASLILAIAFVLLVGTISAGLVGLTTSSLGNRNALQVLRNRQYAADAAVELAVTKVRLLTCTPIEDSLIADRFNRVDIRVDWRNACSVIQTDDGTVVAQRNVVFSACEGSSQCDATNTILRAVVNFQQVGGAVTRTVVQSWSVSR